MKKHHLFTCFCKSKKKTDKGVVLTTAAQEVAVVISSGKTTIEWGDGQTNSYTTDATLLDPSVNPLKGLWGE